MSRKIEFTDRIQPVRLPRSEDLFEGQDAIAAGWADRSSYELQWAPMHVISNLNCSERFSSVFIKNVCAQVNNEGCKNVCAQVNKGCTNCFLDYGGPLVLKSDNRTLIGVFSFFVPSTSRMAQVFSRITPYLKWIEENTGITAN